MRLRGARVGFSVRQSSLENQPDSQGGSCRTTGSRAEDFHVVRYANRAALGLSYTGTPRVRYRLGIWRRLRAGQGELHGKPRRDSDRYSARLFIVRRVF